MDEQYVDVDSAAVIANAKAARAQYQREWYKRHPGKAAEYQRRYWIRRASRIAAEREG